MIKTRISFYLPEETYEKLRRVSYLSRKTQTELIVDALEIMFKTPPVNKHLIGEI